MDSFGQPHVDFVDTGRNAVARRRHAAQRGLLLKEMLVEAEGKLVCSDRHKVQAFSFGDRTGVEDVEDRSPVPMTDQFPAYCSETCDVAGRWRANDAEVSHIWRPINNRSDQGPAFS